MKRPFGEIWQRFWKKCVRKCKKRPVKEKKLIGLTGGIGSGKSRVSRFWSAYSGLPLIDVDQLCRELVEVDEPGWVALKENLATTYFMPDGQLNRQALRSAIFSDETFRMKVNQLIHPLAFDLLGTRIEEIDAPVLVEVPLLYEAGWENQFSRIIVVYADQQTCCRRLVARDGISSQEAAQTLEAQMQIWDKAMRADHVVDNRYGWVHTRMQVVHLDTIFS